MDYKSKYLDKLNELVNSGELNNELADFSNALVNYESSRVINWKEKLKEVEKIWLEYSKDENYFTKILQKTPEEITEAEKSYKEYMVSNNVKTYDDRVSPMVVNSLLNSISYLTDERSPYEFLLFNETFDTKHIAEWVDVQIIYEIALNDPIVKAKQKIYDNNKDFIVETLVDLKTRNKYRIANMLECVDNAISLYENTENVVINKDKIDNVLLPIIDEIYLDFNAYDFIDKYSKAYRKFGKGFLFFDGRKSPEFGEMFIEQYCRPYRLKNEIKLF